MPFAIQHTSQGTFMPAPAGRSGGTYVDPFRKRARQRTTPRLFARRQDAASALDWWLKGEARVEYTGSWGEEDREITGFIPDARRVASDWRVVEVKLEIVP